MIQRKETEMRFSCFLGVPLLLWTVAAAQTTNDHDEFVFVRQQIRGTKSFIPKKGFIPDKETAIAVAYAVAVPVYGQAKVDAEKPLRAENEAGVWTILGTLHGPPGTVGGTLEMQIDQRTGRIIYLGHSQ
jgi:hypothetical protein